MKNKDCKLLILSHIQFGYHTGTLKYCEYLRHSMTVSYQGFDFYHKRQYLEEIEISYVKRGGKTLLNYLRFIIEACKKIKDFKPDYIFMPYFFGASIINLFFLFSKYRRKMIVDIRTSFIFPNKTKTFLANFLLKFEIKAFKNITVISEGLKKFLSLPKRSFILPLGGEPVVFTAKSFKELNFLYVGTFYDRNLTVNIKAFITFYLQLDPIQREEIKYYIIGYGPEADIAGIKDLINENALSNVILFIGEVRYPELNEYMRKCNIGISYIPLRPYYDIQPPTKTFEYLVNGMLVLATSTSENKRVVNDSNGVCASDDYDNQLSGFRQVYEKSFKIDGFGIAEKAKQYSWQFIINNTFKDYLRSINP